jgi:hypothetical protein
MNIGSHLIAGSGVEFRQFLLDQKDPATIGTPNGSGQLYFDTTAGTRAPWFYDGTSWMKWLRKDKAEEISASWDFRIATGTSPITVTSTTKVTNFNADYLDDYHADSSANANTIAQRYTNGRLKVADPSDTQDAVNLGYMTAAIAGATDPKAAVLYTTAAALASYTYLSNVLTAVANGALSVDGQTPAVNDRIGVVYETGAYQQYNGIYVVTVVGDGATQWVMTRSSDADQDSEVTNGLQFWCTAGDTNNGSGWLLTTPDTIILNTTPLTFIQNNGTAQITAGNGIDKTGNELCVLVSGSCTYTPYGVLYHGSSSTLSATAAGTSNTVLHGNTGGAPTWSAVDLTADVSGILPVANGGTGFNTLAGAGIVTTAGMTTSPNTIPKATGSTVLSNSTITDDGTTVSTTSNVCIGTATPVTLLNSGGTAGLSVYSASLSTGGSFGTGTAARAVELDFQNAGVTKGMLGLENSSGGLMITGSSAYSVVLGTSSSSPLHLFSNNTIRFTVSASASTLTGNGASTIATSSGALTLAPASGSNCEVTMTGVGYVNITASGADRSLESTSSGLKTGHNYGTVFTNTSTSDTASISKHGIYVNSVGLWDGGSNPNYAIYIAGASGGDTNWAIYNNTAADVYLGTGNTLIGAAGTPTADLSFGGAATINTLAGALTLAPASGSNVIITTLGAGAITGSSASATGLTISATGAENVISWLFDSSGTSGIGRGALRINAKSGVGSRIEFEQAGADQWTIGPGAASDGSDFEIYNASGTVSMTILKASNNVGIGTTAPQAKLHISGTTSPGVMISDTDAGADVKNYEFYTESGKAYIRRLTDAFSGYDPTITFDSGKVGIGTTSPGAKLDVGGITGWGGSSTGLTASFSGVNSPLNGGGNLRVVGTTTHAADAGASITIGGMYNGTSNQIDFAEISGRKENDTINNVNGYLALATRDNAQGQREWMRITSEGYVGIGISASLAGKLHIQSATDTWAVLSYSDTRASGKAVAIRCLDSAAQFMGQSDWSSDGAANNASTWKLQVGNGIGGALTAITALTSGKVGIGTTTPSSPLTVLTGDSDGILIQGTTTVRPSLLFGNATTGLLCQQTVTNTADWALDVGVGAGVRAIQANAAGTLTLGASVGTITLGGSAYTTAGGILQVTGGVVSAPASIPTGTTIGSVAIARFKTVACVGDNTNEEIDVTHSLSTLSPVVTVWEADGSNAATAVAIVDVTPLSPLAVRLTFSSVQTTSDHYVVAFSG